MFAAEASARTTSTRESASALVVGSVVVLRVVVALRARAVALLPIALILITAGCGPPS